MLQTPQTPRVPDQPDDRLTRWLDAESAADEEGAEVALAELFESLPERPPSVGFAHRVVTRIAAETTAQAAIERRQRAIWSLAWMRGGLATALIALGLVTVSVLGLVAIVAPRFSMADGLRAMTAFLSTFGDRLGLLASSVAAWFELAKLVTKPLASPEVITGSSLLLGLAGMSFVVLRTLIRRERSWTHA